MSNLDRVVALLTRHREERRWTDERVAADMLREFGIDPDADGLPAAPAPVTHEPWPVVVSSPADVILRSQTQLPAVSAHDAGLPDRGDAGFALAEVVPEAELEVVPPEPEAAEAVEAAEAEPAAVEAEPEPAAEVAAEPAPPVEPEPDPPA